MTDRTPRNPNEVILVPMTADAVRFLLNAVTHSAYCHERDGASAAPKVKATHQMSARIHRGLALDLTRVFAGGNVVVGSTFVNERATP